MEDCPVSFQVLVIPEDPTYNGYILQPIVERMLAELGKPNAHVKILTCGCSCPTPTEQATCGRLRSELLERGVHLFCCAASLKLRHGCWPDTEIASISHGRTCVSIPA